MLRIEACDVFDNKNITTVTDDDQSVDSYSFINQLYQKLFILYPYKKPQQDISEKDYNIVKSFTNEKSFEKAVDLCFQLLRNVDKVSGESFDYEDNDDDDTVCVSQDSKILLACLNNLIDCRIPHNFKPGFLIILVRYCFYENT